MRSQQGFDHAGLSLQRIGLHFPLALQRPERLGHRQHVGSRRTVEMMCQKPIDLRGAETTLRLQHQADRGGRRRLQAIQTVLNDMDGLMGQNIQLKPWLIAQPLRSAKTIHAHVVGGAFNPGAATLEAINHNTKLLKPVDQTIRSC